MKYYISKYVVARYFLSNNLPSCLDAKPCTYHALLYTNSENTPFKLPLEQIHDPEIISSQS